MKNENQNQNQNTDITNAPNRAFQSDDAQSPGPTVPKAPNAPSRPRRTTRRRMRRRALPQSEIRNQQSEICGRSKRPHRASPFQPLPELAHLSPDDLDVIHSALRDITVPEAAQFLFDKHAISISHHRLYRYRHRLNLADQLQISEDNAPAIQNLLGLLAGKRVDLDQAGIHIIKQRAVGLAADPNSSPSLLKDLFRIFTYNDRLSLQQRRVKCHERLAKVAERRQKHTEKKDKQEKKLDWRDTSAAALELFGDFPPIIPYDAPLPGEPNDPPTGTPDSNTTPSADGMHQSGNPTENQGA